MGIVPQRLCNQIHFLHTPRRREFSTLLRFILAEDATSFHSAKNVCLETKHKAETGIFVVPHGEVRSPDIVVEIYM